MKTIVKIQLLLFLTFSISSCGGGCTKLNGSYKHFEYYQASGGSSLKTYEFSGNKVKIYSGWQTNRETKLKSDSSTQGNFRMEEDKIIMNFGGSDVFGYVNRDSNGCISSLSIRGENFSKDK